jgi:AraC-like DNA-binding protein
VPTDVLSEVLNAVRLSGAIYFDLDLSAPWALEAPPAQEVVGKVMPRAQRVVEYHLMASGHAWARWEGAEPVRMREGDLILFPQGDAHTITSTPELRGKLDMSLFDLPSAGLPHAVEFGGGGSERARLMCGFLGFDERPFNPLLRSLPRVIHLCAEDLRATGAWLQTLLHVAVRESGEGRPGGDNILARVSELMFVEAIRRHVAGLPPSETGWLAGLRDPLVGRALTALHGGYCEQWTVERLARTVGASRSVLAERFTEMVGQPPMQYLALWRMQLASRRLLTGESITAVASAVGYESEAAFSRAFKKLVGDSPAAWRRAAR